MSQFVTFSKNAKGKYIAAECEIRPVARAKSKAYPFITVVHEAATLEALLDLLDDENPLPVRLPDGNLLPTMKPSMLEQARDCVELVG